MAYPKPLQVKTIANQFKRLGLDQSQIDFIHQFVTAVTNLYGFYSNRGMWEIYRENRLIEHYPKLHRDQFYESLVILRREEGLSFRVYDIDELTDDTEGVASKWFAINLDLIKTYRRGKAVLEDVDELVDRLDDVDVYLPENLLDYAEHSLPESAHEFLTFLSGLKGTEPVVYNNLLQTDEPSKFYGKRLDEVNDADFMEIRELNMIKRQMFDSPAYQKKYRQMMARLQQQTAAKFVTDQTILLLRIIGDVESGIQFVLQKLSGYGVLLDDFQSQQLAKLYLQLFDDLHLWCKRGWSYGDIDNYIGTDEYY